MRKRVLFLEQQALSREQIVDVLVRMPQVFSLDIEANLKPKVEVWAGLLACGPKRVEAAQWLTSLPPRSLPAVSEDADGGDLGDLMKIMAAHSGGTDDLRTTSF